MARGINLSLVRKRKNERAKKWPRYARYVRKVPGLVAM